MIWEDHVFAIIRLWEARRQRHTKTGEMKAFKEVEDETFLDMTLESRGKELRERGTHEDTWRRWTVYAEDGRAKSSRRRAERYEHGTSSIWSL